MFGLFMYELIASERHQERLRQAERRRMLQPARTVDPLASAGPRVSEASPIRSTAPALIFWTIALQRYAATLEPASGR